MTKTDWSVTDSDGAKLDEWCSALNVRTVLEFGPGYSTGFLAKNERKVVSLESDPVWRDRLAPELAELDVELFMFNAASMNLSIAGVDERVFDFGFVDAPVGTERLSRLNSALYAQKRCRYVALHDTDRPGERQTIEVLQALGCVIADRFTEGKGLVLLATRK